MLRPEFCGVLRNSEIVPRAGILQDFAYSYRVWITLIKLFYAVLRYLKIDPDIHASE